MVTGIENRCLNDVNTKLRKKYDLYYHSFEKQKGSHVWLNGKEYILLNSNDYLGLGNHPKVIERTVEYIKK
jgi:7-keto-8-aminopelargonate synthetase-like enzyme